MRETGRVPAPGTREDLVKVRASLGRRHPVGILVRGDAIALHHMSLKYESKVLGTVLEVGQTIQITDPD